MNSENDLTWLKFPTTKKIFVTKIIHLYDKNAFYNEVNKFIRSLLNLQWFDYLNKYIYCDKPVAECDFNIIMCLWSQKTGV